MLSSSRARPLESQRILLAHSNAGDALLDWHARRAQSAIALGYDLSLFSMSEHYPYTIFPYLDRLWRKREPRLMRFYEVLGKAIDACDVFIHYNGAMIHPEFLAQFDKLSIYHCADDPDASAVLSRPVASHYDICAISNPACVEMYKAWGCSNTFFWPLGALSYADGSDASAGRLRFADRDIPLVFIGSKLGVPSVRFIGKYLGLYRKKRVMTRVERACPELVAYGSGWSRGWATDEMIPQLYRRSRVGLNLHNSLGPVNGRLYDLAAFGICQVCDNKATLNLVFEPEIEIVGFATVQECIDSVRYYVAHPDEAERIGTAARARYLRDYSMTAIWIRFFAEIDRILRDHA